MKKTTIVLIALLVMILRILPGSGLSYGDIQVAEADNPLAGHRSFKGWPIQNRTNTGFLLSLHASYLQPVGDFAKIAGPGVSLVFGCSYRGLLMENLVLGVETGVFFISPAVDNITLNMLVPLYLTAAYDVALPWDLCLSPEAGIGYSYNMLFYKEYDSSSDKLETKMNGAFEPILMGGLALSYRGFGRISLFLELRYYLVGEEGGPIHITAVNAGAALRI